MASIKKILEIINKNTYLTFILLLSKVFDLIVGAIKSPDMDSFISFLKHFDWIGTVFILISIFIAYAFISQMKIDKKENGKRMAEAAVKELELENRLTSLEEFVRIRDQNDMEEEMIDAISFWVHKLNNTIEERNEYIIEKFPRNAQKIQNYLLKYYQGIPPGMRTIIGEVKIR